MRFPRRLGRLLLALAGLGSEFGTRTLEAMPSSLIDGFTAQVAFSHRLFSISNFGGISAEGNLTFSGARLPELFRLTKEDREQSWVGAGFSLGWPQVRADLHGNTSLDDDEYFASLDGVTYSKLVAVQGATNQFVLKDQPHIRAERWVQPGQLQLVEKDGGSEPIESTPTSVISGWKFTLASGTQVVFGDASPTCQRGGFVPSRLCKGVIGDRVQFSDFYRNEQSSIADVWFIKRIFDKGGRFSLNYLYEKDFDLPAAGTYLDRGLYPTAILANRGPDENHPVLRRLSFHTSVMGSDLVKEKGADAPHHYYYRRKLDSIGVSEFGTPLRTLVFDYAKAGKDLLRLNGITEFEPKQGKFRVIFSFDYDGQGRLAEIVDDKRVEARLQYQSADVGQADYGIDLSMEKDSKAYFLGDYGSRFFMGFQKSKPVLRSRPDESPNVHNEIKLGLFENNRLHWTNKIIGRLQGDFAEGCKQ